MTMTDPKNNPTKTPKSTTETKETAPTLDEQVKEKEAALVIGQPTSQEPPPPPPPAGAPVDAKKAAADRKEILALDSHDIRREGAVAPKSQGPGPVPYMPPQLPDVVASDTVLAAEGMLSPDKAEAMIADQEKFQRPGFVEALKKQREAEEKAATPAT